MAKNWLLTFKTGIAMVLMSVSVHSTAKSFTGFGVEIDSYIRLAANRYQVSETMLRGLVKFEDGWTGKISPTGATGVGQFTAGTWNWLSETPRGRELGMRPVTKYNRGTSYDPRRNKYINTLATALLARWHIERFVERGIATTDENLYMAHNIGLEGLHRALLGKSTRSDIANMRKNGMKPWHSVNDFLRYQKSRYTEHKNIANFQNSSRKEIAPLATVAKVATKSVSSAKSSVRLAIPSKIRYIEPTDKVNWIEPSLNKTVWILSK